MIQQKQPCVRGPNDGFPQVIYIAPMSDPWTIDGARHEVAAPELAWEEARIRPDSTRSTALVCYGGTGRRPMCRSAIRRSARGAPPCVPLRRRSLRVAMPDLPPAGLRFFAGLVSPNFPIPIQAEFIGFMPGIL